MLVVAGDNLFDFSLADYVDWWKAKDGSAIAVYEQPNPELVSQYSVVELDPDDRVVSFVEKPEKPESNLTAIATYIYHRAHLALLRAYIAEGNSPDQPGHFIAWLHTRAPVYGYRFGGEWLDIGDRTQLLEADNRYRRRAGLPERDQYSVDRPLGLFRIGRSAFHHQRMVLRVLALGMIAMSVSLALLLVSGGF